MADLSGPWWDWAARLRRIMAEREAAAERSRELRAGLDADREAGKAIRHRRRLDELARWKREG